jgi:glycosyltransferase involved in cell wall biosynthesis
MRLSVIIPAYNATAVLDRCLHSLGASVFRDYECIVVDDASTDDSPAIAERYGVKVMRLERNGGPSRARNRGAEVACGEILVFIDSDVCVHPDTLSRIDAHFREHPTTDALMGSYDDTPAHPAFVSQYKNLFHHYVHHRSSSEAWTFWAGCGAVRRDVFLRFGGFDESYTRPSIEDIELGARLHAAGHRIDLNPEIQVTHLKRWTLWGLVRTDVRDRGVPWLLLMLRERSMPADLNVTFAHRISVALVGALVLLAGAMLLNALVGPLTAFRLPVAGAWGMVFCAALLLFLNRDLYQFFARKRGLLFAIGTVPLHWLYYAYCGVSVLLALAAHLWQRLTGQRLVSGPSATQRASN